MTRWPVTVRGSGRVTLPAFGVADAEDRVEKEIRARLPDAVLQILSVERPADSSRIVEEFTLAYRLRLELEVEAENADDARTIAFRTAREHLAGSRYARAVWESGR